SDDGGDTWVRHGDGAPDDQSGHLFMDYRGGKFVVYADSGASWESADALTFTPMPGVQHANYCDGQWRDRDACPQNGGEYTFETFAGYVSSQWFDNIRFSENGTDGWSTVANPGNPIYQSRAFAEGWLAP